MDVQDTENRSPKGYEHVYQVDDLEFIKRFLILGRPEPVYAVGCKGLLKENTKKVRDKIESIIKKLQKDEKYNNENANGGTEMTNPVVDLIRKINSDQSSISQNPVLYCLAVCTRSDHKATKTAAFQILNDVCRIPTHLFQFIEYYTVLTKERHENDKLEDPDIQDEGDKDECTSRKTQENDDMGTVIAHDHRSTVTISVQDKENRPEQNQKRKTKKVNDHAAYGWGRAFKRAISKWFLSKDPEYLAYLLTKYRRRSGWSVKTVIRLAHIKSEDIIVKKRPKRKKKRPKRKKKAAIAGIDNQKADNEVKDKDVTAETDNQTVAAEMKDYAVTIGTDNQKAVDEMKDETVVVGTDNQRAVDEMKDETVTVGTDNQRAVDEMKDETVTVGTDNRRAVDEMKDETVVVGTDNQKAVDEVKDKVVIAGTDKQKAVGFILRYFRSSLQKAQTFYEAELSKTDNTVLQSVADMLENYNVLRKSTETDTETIKSKIRAHRYITTEHLSPKVTSAKSGKTDIWRDLILNIPGHSLVRHAGFLTKINVLEASDDDLPKTTMETFKNRLNEYVIPPPNPDIPASQRSFTRRVPLHPFKLLTALLQYKEGHSIVYPHRKSTISSWIPVEKVTAILEDAYKSSESIANKSGRFSNKICIAIDVSGSMTEKRVNGATEGITCRSAAAALAFNIARNGSNVDVLVFNENGATVLDVGEGFGKFLLAVSDHSLPPSAKTDCSEPLMWAYKQKQTATQATEAFIVLTVNENAKNREPLAHQLKRYRNYTQTKPKVIICTMNVTTVTGAAKFDRDMLDICGFDSKLPWLIKRFVENDIGTNVESQ